MKQCDSALNQTNHSTHIIEDTLERTEAAAYNWCSLHQGWKLLSNVENPDALFKDWHELSDKTRASWIREFGEIEAKQVWEEFGLAPCKVPYGFITSDGYFNNSKSAEFSPRFTVMVVKCE